MNRIYIGKKPCGCIVAATLDPDDIADMARDGLIIETVDRRSVEVKRCECHEKESATKV